MNLRNKERNVNMFRARMLIAAATVALAVTGTSGPASAAAPAPAAWQPQTLPADDGNLLGMAQPDPRTTWAVGFRRTVVGKGTELTPLLLTHQNGSAQGWTTTDTAPLPDGATTRFNAVTALSDHDGWVVGDDSGAVGGIVAEHWDGSSWRLTAAPAPDKTADNNAGLLGVSGTSATDAWAVGWVQILDSSVTDPATGRTHEESHQEGLAEHWDGTAWHQVPLPAASDIWALTGVTAIAADDVWAVGYGTGDQPVLMHYDGHAWTHVPTPPLDGTNGEFNAVTATGPDDVWAVGRIVRDDKDPGHALVAHWNGRAWHQVDVPPQAGRLSAVTAGPNGITAVGRTTRAPFPGPGADGYAMRLDDHGRHSLDLPSGTFLDPNAVAVTAQGQTSVAGYQADPTQGSTQPMILTDN